MQKLKQIQFRVGCSTIQTYIMMGVQAALWLKYWKEIPTEFRDLMNINEWSMNFDLQIKY